MSHNLQMLSSLTGLMRGAPVVWSLYKNLGLNPGKNFEKWMEDSLAVKGIKTMADLERLSKLPTLYYEHSDKK